MFKHREFVVPAIIPDVGGLSRALEGAFVLLSEWQKRHEEYATVRWCQWVRIPHPQRPVVVVEVVYETDRDFDPYDDADLVKNFETVAEETPKGIILGGGE